MRRGFLSGPSSPRAAPCAAPQAAGVCGAQELRGSAACESRPAPQLGAWRFLYHGSDGVDANLMVLFHGRGCVKLDRAAPFAAFARKLALPQTAVLALEGPLEVPYSDGGRAWFSAFEHDGTLICPAPGELRRLRSLASTLESLYEALRALVAQGWRYNQLHLFGFGDGGTVALELALRFGGAQKLGSCVAVSASLLAESLDACEWEAPPPPHTPVLLTRGDGDDGDALLMRTRETILRLAPTCGPQLAAMRGMPRQETEVRQLMTFWSHVLRANPVGVTAAGDTLVELS